MLPCLLLKLYNFIGDNIESRTSEDLQFLVQDGASSALSTQVFQQHSDLKPVNAYLVSEPFCSPISRVSSSAVNRPRFELSGKNGIYSKWSPPLNEVTAEMQQHFSAMNSNVSGKCVRFNADVQVTSVSPRMAHKVVSPGNGGNGPPNEHTYNRYHCTELYTRNSADLASDEHICNSEVGSNMYDEVASTASSQKASPNLKSTNELHSLSANRVISDLPMAELQRKFRKNQTIFGQESSSTQPLYSNIDQTFSETKIANQSNCTVSQQKSILKDPLCAKLRSSILKGQFAMTDSAQLESEIDSLFCGNESAKSDANDVDAHSRVSVIGGEEKSTCDIFAPNMLAGLELNEKLQNGKSYQSKSPSNAFKVFSKKNSSTSNSFVNDVNTAPCNSYIQMIEEKYRSKEISSTNQNKIKAGKSTNKGMYSIYLQQNLKNNFFALF